MKKTYIDLGKESRSDGGVSPIGRGRERLRTVGEIIKKDLYVNSLSIDMLYDRTL